MIRLLLLNVLVAVKCIHTMKCIALYALKCQMYSVKCILSNVCLLLL